MVAVRGHYARCACGQQTRHGGEHVSVDAVRAGEAEPAPVDRRDVADPQLRDDSGVDELVYVAPHGAARKAGPLCDPTVARPADAVGVGMVSEDQRHKLDGRRRLEMVEDEADVANAQRSSVRTRDVEDHGVLAGRAPPGDATTA